MINLLLGLDIGTKHIKAAAVDEKGLEHSVVTLNSPRFTGDDGYDYYCPYKLKDITFKAIRDVLYELTAKYSNNFEILGVAAASMAEAGVPLDKNGEPLYDIIPWFDMRTKDITERFGQIIDREKVYFETGQFLQPKYSIHKIIWIKEKLPHVFKKTNKWLCIQDYIIYCLTGKYVTDYTIAARTMALNCLKGEWSDDILNAAGVKKEIFPEIIKSGTTVGTVLKSISEKCGLKEGTPVINGGHDHICAAFSCGIKDNGDVFDSMGTAESIIAVTDTVKPKKEYLDRGFSIGRYLCYDKFCIEGGIQGSGASVEWYIENILGDRKNNYDMLMEVSGNMPEGPSGIFYVPHLMGSGAPYKNPASKAAFIGIKAGHKRVNLLKAVYEGIAFEFRQMLESLCDVDRATVSVFKAAGGSTKNSEFMKIRADIMGMDILVSNTGEAAAVGAALLAGLGAGVFKNSEDIEKKSEKTYGRYCCDFETHRKYNYLYDNGYKKLYNTLKNFGEVLDFGKSL